MDNTEKSNEERWFEMWLDELIQHGLVSEYICQPDPFLLSEPLNIAWHKQKKKGEEIVTQTIIREHIYTPDYFVKFTSKAYPILVDRYRANDHRKYQKEIITQGGNAFIETKGGFDRNNMIRLASINIKWVYAKYGIIVNMLKIPNLFADTFTPKAYLFTEKTKQPRKIKFKVKTIEEFLNQQS
jgi:hypothetical protein